jgi:hypothetical protein
MSPSGTEKVMGIECQRLEDIIDTVVIGATQAGF